MKDETASVEVTVRENELLSPTRRSRNLTDVHPSSFVRWLNTYMQG